jgi:epoxyqueuosine reductase
MLKELHGQLTDRGYQGRVVSVEHLVDLQDEIEGHYKQGLLDRELYQAYLARFTFGLPDNLPEARSVIIVAVPQPKIELTFTWNGERLRTTIPPTYPERKIDKHVMELLGQVLAPAGYRVTEALLPKKLLAVRSGLASYGRNNISYVPGMGSFHALVAVYSDLPAPEDNWREPQMMESCQNCSACQRYCPVGAISSERFLLHAERCITFHNEKPGDVPFSPQLDLSWHNCLVGCLHCQRVCPENRKCWHWAEEGAEFSAEETLLLLEGVPVEQLPASTVEKLEQWDLDMYADVLPRNLNALLH